MLGMGDLEGCDAVARLGKALKLGAKGAEDGEYRHNHARIVILQHVLQGIHNASLPGNEKKMKKKKRRRRKKKEKEKKEKEKKRKK
jgi:hypothetical protein